eukprot:maker-scaffold171_size289870-snap-gene-1.39 protein:Tk00433 transcript:maker-scaffold171_size289870-snap-gene-1.39-mRNA-1 annotation:"hypothetical protein DAPPUDRAFT_306990"
MKFLDKVSSVIVGGFERFFYWYGKLISRSPWLFLIGCLVGAGLCGIGLMELREETNAFKLWVPSGSDFVANNEWLEANFPPDTRYNNVLLTAPNVLTPAILKQMFEIHQSVSTVNLTDGQSWDDVCKRVPVIDLPGLGKQVQGPGNLRQSPCDDPSANDYDPSICLDSEIYCQVLDQSLSEACLETSILELFGYEAETYDNLDEESILKKVNEDTPTSVVFKRPIDIGQLLSLTRDADGKIIGARAASLSWLGQVDLEHISDGSSSNAGTGVPVDALTLEFEDKVFDIFQSFRPALMENGADILINIAKGYDDIAAETIIGDAFMMPVGFTIVFVYVMIMLGKFNCVETRAFLSLVGLASIGLTILVTYGLCSAFGLFYGPMHNVIPFLMLGIGIDDMFVIMQCFDNLRPHEVDFKDHERMIGLTMKHAGVAITVTSITDFLVFMVGSSTSLPALRSFCLYCGVGIIAVYFFQATFFVAALALDLRRLNQNRNGILFCYKHKIEPAEKESEADYEYLSQKVFRIVGQIITKPLVKGRQF